MATDQYGNPINAAGLVQSRGVLTYAGGLPPDSRNTPGLDRMRRDDEERAGLQRAAQSAQSAALAAMSRDTSRYNAQASNIGAARALGVQQLQPMATGETSAAQKAGGEEQAGRMREALGAREATAAGGIQEANQAAQALGPESEGRRQEALGAAGALRQEALADVQARQDQAKQEFQDMTAAAIQTQRGSVMSGLKQQEQDIINQAAQSGLGPDSPQVQQQLTQARQATSQQLGNLAASVGVAYNDAKAKLTVTYDDMNTRTRALEDQIMQATREAADKNVGLSSAQGAELMAANARTGASLYMSAQQEARMVEQQLASLNLAADQLQLAGLETTASFVRDWDVMMAPLAPAAALAAQFARDAAPGGVDYMGPGPSVYLSSSRA